MEHDQIFDLLVIGGGINGTAIARDAAGRGLSVMLVEQNDLASGTSSKSTKLIHGGLRYLEFYDFKLVREALIEREVLLNAAPHIIWPLRFVLPYHDGLRPKWLIRLGLFLYDHLGGRKILPPTKSLDLSADPAGAPLREEFTTGYEYSDCWVEDARLVVLNAMDAKQKGAVIAPRTTCVSAKRGGGAWEVTLEGQSAGIVKAKVLINAAGPWVRKVIDDVVREGEQAKIRLVKGSHIVLDKLYDHDRCYIFQNADGRIFFAIPYERDFTLIGTTDEDFHGAPGPIEIDDAEVDYLLASAGAYFRRPLKKEMLRWSYAGVRSLYDDGAGKAQAATREYVLKLEGAAGTPQILSVFGGKLTTSRKLAEEAVAKIGSLFPQLKPAWTRNAKLPGGMDYSAVENYVTAAKKRYSFLKPQEIERLFYTYGSRMEQILGDARFAVDLGKRFGPVWEREIDYLKANEWAQTSEDILWRRTKLGLHMSDAEITALKIYLGELKPARKKKQT